MRELQDIELLRQYARENSDEAFAALVSRHVNMVYSAALRKSGNPAAAEEITQAVFVILAKKAKGLLRHTALSGWLYQATRLTAANFLRTEIRRARREQEAYMQSLSNQTEPEIWTQIMPLLEDAMGRLGEKDRNALALRFFEGKSFQDIGAAFGVSENAARKRTTHALEKLRAYFSQCNVTSTSETIAGAISANSVQAAPVALAKSVTATALTKGATASTSTLTLVKGALKLMAWTKAKIAIVAGAGALVITGSTVGLITTTHPFSHPINEKIPPKIIAFKASPPATQFGNGFTISYTVSARGGSQLNGVELWRSHVNGTGNDVWTQIGATIPLSGDGPVSGTFPVDIPTEAGNYWYGIHVSDRAGNVIYEDQAGFAPARVQVVP